MKFNLWFYPSNGSMLQAKCFFYVTSCTPLLMYHPELCCAQQLFYRSITQLSNRFLRLRFALSSHPLSYTPMSTCAHSGLYSSHNSISWLQFIMQCIEMSNKLPETVTTLWTSQTNLSDLSCLPILSQGIPSIFFVSSLVKNWPRGSGPAALGYDIVSLNEIPENVLIYVMDYGAGNGCRRIRLHHDGPKIDHSKRQIIHSSDSRGRRQRR